MLKVDGVSVRFGGINALTEVSVEVPAGSVTGLIGPNGAGKTTLFNVVNGLQRPNGGHVLLADRDITRLAPQRRARRGIARTFQRLETFGSMSARENILVAAELHRRYAGRHVNPPALTDEILERLELSPVAQVQADTLPTGLARLVEVGRALATEPSVLLLDEPSSGLNTAETSTLGDVLLDLARSGMAILLVEHDMELAMRVSQQLYVLDFGRVIAIGPPAAIQADPAVRLAYLGAEAHAGGPATPAVSDVAEPASIADDGRAAVIETAHPAHVADAAPVTSIPSSDGSGDTVPELELVGVRAGYGAIEVLHGVDLSVAPGTVFALLGANGAGKSTSLKVASGRLRPTAGVVRFAGADATKWRAERLARAGLCTIPEGRGIFPNLTVAENLQMWTFRGRLRRRDVEDHAYARFPILGERRRQVAGTLSGGEQQMLAMSRALSTDPKLLLLDEISMGLAPLIVAELYEVVANLSAEGLAILVVEQSARTALSVAHRAAVMANGRIVLSGKPEEIADSVFDIYLAAADGRGAGS